MARDRNPEGTNRKRTVEVRLKLSPTLAEKFSLLAEQRGLLPATLAAVVIGEYLEKKDENTALQGKVALHASSLMASSFTDEKMASIIKLMMSDPELLKLMAQAEEGSAGQSGSSAAPQAAAQEGLTCAAGDPS